MTAHFADGSTARGKVLIGADGLKLVVREQLHGKSEPRYAGYAARRGVLQAEVEGRMRVILGRARRFAYFPVGGPWVYWSASTNEPAGGEESPVVLKRAVLERFEGWPYSVEEFVKGTADSNTFRADTYDRDPLKRWGEGRVTLLGDAAHPMTWDQGQGACQGIEGAVLLSRSSLPRTARIPPRRSGCGRRTASHVPARSSSARAGWASCVRRRAPVVRVVRNRAVKMLTGSKKESAHLLVDY